MEARIAAEIAIATSEKSWPASCSTNRMGANTSTVVSVEASTAGHTSRTPAIVACSRSIPLRRSRSMFSSTTIVLSTVMPIAKAMPASEITLIVRPASSRPRNAASVQIGMPITPTSVAWRERRNRYMTRVASTAPSSRFWNTLRTESSTYLTSSFTSRSSSPLRSSSVRLMSSTTGVMARLMAITFEPGSRRTERLSARWPAV